MGIVRIMEDQLWLELFSISCYEKYWRKAKNQMSIKKFVINHTFQRID